MRPPPALPLRRFVCRSSLGLIRSQQRAFRRKLPWFNVLFCFVLFCFVLFFFFWFFGVVDVRLGVDPLMAASATEVARKGLRFMDVGSLAHFFFVFFLFDSLPYLYAPLRSLPPFLFDPQMWDP